MNRITPGMVKEAYAKTGFEPAREIYCKDGKLCGLSVVAVATGQVHWLDIENLADRDEPGLWSLLAGVLDVDGDYISGFITGYDATDATIVKPEERNGYADGRKAAAVIFGDTP